MSKIREYENTAEIGTYLHIDEGQARVKSYTAVNEPLKIDSAQLTKKVGGVRVKMLVEEDTGVKKDGSFYHKSVWNEQERDNTSSPSTGFGSHSVGPQGNSSEAPSKDGLTPLQVLKNFVDNIAADVRQHTWLIVVTMLVAAIALGIAIFK